MIDTLATIDYIIDKVNSQIAADSKLEEDVVKTLSDLITNVVRSEKMYKVTEFDDISLKMKIDKPKLLYEIKEKRTDGLKLLLSKI